MGALAQGPAHGYDLYQYLAEHLADVWTLGLSQVYALLGRLEQDGLVVHDRVEQASRPAKKIHRLTDEGRAQFTAWVASPVRHMRDLRLEFLAKLFFARRLNGKAEERLLSAQRRVCAEIAAGLAARCQEAESETKRRALDFRRTMAQAALDWLERL